MLRRRGGVLAIESAGGDTQEDYLLRGDGRLFRLSPRIRDVLVRHTSLEPGARSPDRYAETVISSAIHNHIVVPAKVAAQSHRKERHHGDNS